MWYQNCRVNIEVQTLLPREKIRPLFKGWGVGCLKDYDYSPLHYRLMHAMVQPALETECVLHLAAPSDHHYEHTHTNTHSSVSVKSILHFPVLTASTSLKHIRFSLGRNGRSVAAMAVGGRGGEELMRYRYY